MALDVGELLVSIKADLTDLKKGLDEANTKVGGFGTGTVAMGNLISAAVQKFSGEVARYGMDCIKAFGEEQLAIGRLEVALRNAGSEVTNTSKDLQEYAMSLMKTTTYSHETSLEMMSLLTTFGLTGDEMKKALQAAMDLSAGVGIDLRIAVLAMGKAAIGENPTIRGIGNLLADGTPKALMFSEAIKAVNSRFGGSEAAKMETSIGKIAALSNQFDELKETIGELLMPVFNFYIQRLLVLFQVIDGVKGSFRNLGMAALELSKSVTVIGDAFGVLFPIFKLFGINVEAAMLKVNGAIDKQIAKLNQWGRQEEKVIDNSVNNYKVRNRLKERMDQEEENERKKKLAKESADTDKQTVDMLAKYTTRNDMMVVLQTKFTAAQSSILNNFLDVSAQKELLDQVTRLENQGKFDDARLLKETTLKDATVKMGVEQNTELTRQNQLRMQNLQTVLGQISTLSSVKNKELAAIGKAAAISMATMDTLAAATKALNATPWPPANAVMAAAVYAAGMANVAKIVGVKLARGGVVMPQDGGVTATIGEGGSAEAVIPLNDPRAKREMAGAMGGGTNITVQISGQFIEGSPSKMQKLVRETLVPEIRRFTDYNSKGPFTRRRGRSN